MPQRGQAPEGDPAVHRTQHLVARLRAGEAERFNELYERIAPSLWAWAHLRLRHETASTHEVEDFLQEVWLRAIDGLPGFDPERSGFRAWIFGIAKNVAYEDWRRGASSSGSSQPSASALLDDWPDIATSIRTRLSKDEALKLFLDQVAKLDATDRMLLVHCGLEDLPCAQVARRLGLGEEAAAKRWQRLRNRLRDDRCAQLLEG
jgi:RNA polymerase sigma factor (sigma-70 family)